MLNVPVTAVFVNSLVGEIISPLGVTKPDIPHDTLLAIGIPFSIARREVSRNI